MGRRTAASGVSAPAGGIVHAGCAPHFLFETSKRKCAAPGGKEKMFGGSVCAGADLLPPAGDSWHSLVEVRDGNARPLGKPLARGGRRIHPAPIFAAAGSSARERERQRKEKLRQYDNHPDEVGTIRHGTVVTKIAEGPGVPEGKPKSALAPIRRPPCARRATAPKCAQAAFSFGPCTARFLFRKTEKKMGGASPLDKPPCGSRIPRGRRPAARISPGCAPKREDPPLYFSSNTDTYTVPVTSNPSLAFT